MIIEREFQTGFLGQLSKKTWCKKGISQTQWRICPGRLCLYRGQGIGRKLFDIGKEETRKAGAKALYISACSSEETIAFYKAMGAELTNCPIKEIEDAEPYDLQMVCYV